MNKSLYNAIKTINSSKENRKILQKHIESGSSNTQSTSSIIKITYNDLKQLRDESKLIPGQQYRIIDYVTRCFAENITSAVHPFDIIVTASSENSLFEEARAIQREGDEYFKNSNLLAWKIWYCLDNDENRFSWIKNIPSTLYIHAGFDDKCTGVLKYIGTTYIFIWDAVLGKSKRKIFSTDTYIVTDNYHIAAADDWVICYFDENNVSHSVRNGIGEEDGNYIIDKIEDYPTGVIYRMIDEFDNDMPYDFKNIIFYNEVNIRREGDYGIIKDNYPEALLDFNSYTINYYKGRSKDLTLLPENYNNKICKTIKNNKQNIIPFSLLVCVYCKNIKIGTNVEGVVIGTFDKIDGVLYCVDNLEIDNNTIINSINMMSAESYIVNKRYSCNIHSLYGETTMYDDYKYYGLEIG